MYKLSYYKSLALVKEEGKASRAYIDGACADRASVEGACVGEAYADGVCAGRASIKEAYIGGAYTDRAYADRACIGRRLFKTTRAKTRVADDIKGVDKRDLKQ